jgi:hypothetical protein
MAIADDFSVATNGDIRHVSGSSTYTVLEFHRYLQDLADDAQASGDDLVDITTDTPSDRSTDEIITLNSPFNIDDTAARFLYDGSITQNGGNDLYSGLRVLGTVEANTEIMIIQDDKVLPAWWGTGVNPDAANAVIMRLLIKSRSGGADIDGKKILTMARELGDQYKEFSVTLGLANSVSAISTAADLNNESSDATIEAWSTITNVEGYQLIDIDNDTVDEEYYAQFDKGSQSLNDTYERAKWVSQRSHDTSDTTEQTGTDYIVDNATIVGQGQEFTANGQAEILTEMRVFLKIGLGSPTGPLTMELIDSDDGSPPEPTGAVLATSEEVLASLITSSYTEVIFRFNDNVTLTASQTYFGVIRHPTGDGSNYFHVRGDATGTGTGSQAVENPAATWTGDAAQDLDLLVKSSPVWHSQAGEKFRGITHEIVYSGESGGPFTEDATIFWGTRITYDGESGTFEVGRYVYFGAEATPTTPKNGGKILFDDTAGNVLYVALEDSTGAGNGQLLDNDKITQIGGTAASADIATTIVDDDKAGGIGRILALDDNGTDGDLYIQLIHGSAPVDTLRMSENLTRYAVVNTTVTARTVSPEFIGATTGTNLIGAYGIGFQTTDIGSSDKFFDLTNAQRTPPNNVTFTVTGLVSGQDRVLVGPRTGTTLEKGLWLVATGLTGTGEVILGIKSGAEDGPIATDTPQNGTGANTRLRVQLDNGVYRRLTYASYANYEFTLTGENFTGSNASVDNEVFPAYIDVLADATSEAYTAVYSSDRNLLVRVRDGGATPIKTFEGEGTFGSTSSSLAAIRTTDA